MPNPYNNEVIFNGRTLMSLKEDTITPNKVLAGETFHDRSGAPQTGSLITHNVYDGLDSASTSDALSANQGRVLNEKYNTLNSNMPKLKTVYFHSSAADQTIKIVTNGIVALFIFGIYRDNGADKTREGYGLIKIYNNTPIFTRKVGLEGYTLAYNPSTDEMSITIPGYCSGAVFVPVL